MNQQTSTGLNISEKMKIAEKLFNDLKKTDVDKGSYVHGVFDGLFENEVRIIELKENNQEILEALKSARDVLVMASLIDKSKTCSNETDAADKILSKYITNYKP